MAHIKLIKHDSKFSLKKVTWLITLTLIFNLNYKCLAPLSLSYIVIPFIKCKICSIGLVCALVTFENTYISKVSNVLIYIKECMTEDKHLHQTFWGHQHILNKILLGSRKIVVGEDDVLLLENHPNQLMEWLTSQKENTN